MPHRSEFWFRATACLGLLSTLACADLKFVNAEDIAGSAGTSSMSVAGAAPSGGKGGESNGAGGGPSAGAGSTSAVTAGTAGDAGESDAGSGGEGGDAGPSCPHAEGALRAGTHPEFPESSLNEPHPFVLLTNSGAAVELRRIRARYYFTAESTGDFRTACYWVTKVNGLGGDSGLCDRAHIEVVAMPSPATDADSYLELSFDPAEEAQLAKGAPLEIRAGFWLDSRLSFTQTNDYSFLPTSDEITEVNGFPYRGTTRVTLYVDGQLVWGTEPCNVL